MTTLDASPSAGGAMDDERVYIPIQPEEIQALSRATGAKVWERDIESAWPPVLLNGALFVAASDEIHALDPETGAEKWRVEYDHPMIAPLTAATRISKKDRQSTLDMRLDVLIAVLEKGEVVAFAAEDGRTLWTQQLGSATHFAPATDNSNAVFALDDSRVVALDLASGARAWALALEGKLNQPSNSLKDNRIFVGSDNNDLYALDAARGRLVWKWRAGGDVLGISADETGGGAYYASLDNVLRSVNQSNGNQRWIKEIPTRPLLPPMTFGDGPAYEDVVVLTGVTSEIDAFGVKKGVPAGMYLPMADLQGAPLINPKLKPYSVSTVVITRDGRAFGLRPTAMMLPEPPVTPLIELPGRKLERDRIGPAPAATPAPATKATKTNYYVGAGLNRPERSCTWGPASAGPSAGPTVAPCNRVPEYPHHLRTFDYVGLRRYFLTFCTFERNRLFVTRDAVDLTHQQILRAAVEQDFSIHVYCYMPDHLHLLVEAEREDCNLKILVSRAKQYSGFHFKRATSQALWQRYGYERVLRNDEETMAVARYVIDNPVRAGLVAGPLDYPFWGSPTWPREELIEYARRAG